MASYIYEHPETGELTEVVQGMNEKHEFFDENGIQWNRVYTVPQIGIDVKNINPFSKKDFLKKTDKPGSVGDLLDRSKEFSERRKDKEGIDTIEQKYYSDYSKIRHGRKHINQLPKEISI